MTKTSWLSRLSSDVLILVISPVNTSAFLWLYAKDAAAYLFISTPYRTLIPAIPAPKLRPPAPEKMSIPIRDLLRFIFLLFRFYVGCAHAQDAQGAQDAQKIYKSKLFGSVRNWRKPMVTIPSSFRRSRMSSLTITIFLKLSSSALSGRSS